MRNARALLIMALVGGLWACRDNELTRSKAAELLSRKFPSRREWRIAPPIFAKGVVDELWTDETLPGTHGMLFTLTPEGKQHIKAVISNPDLPPTVIDLVQPVALTIDVTGIAADPSGASNERHVEFTWAFTGQSEPVLQLLRWCLETADPPPWRGEAVFQLFDDGWRLQQVTGVPYVPGTDNSFEVRRESPFPRLADPVEVTLRRAVAAFKRLQTIPGNKVTYCNSAEDCRAKLPGFTPSLGMEVNLGEMMSGNGIYADAWRAGATTKYSYNDQTAAVTVLTCHGVCR